MSGDPSSQPSMATVKKANVPPTHPTVWLGLGLAAIGLLVATYAYTGARVYEVLYAFVALGGALLALAGILLAAWGRSIMAARASRSRRSAFKEDALALAKPVPVTEAIGPAAASSEDAPTIAASREKKRFSFPMPKRAAKPKKDAASEGSGASGAGAQSGASVFAFKRRATEAPAPAAPPEPAPSPVLDAELDAIGDLRDPKTVRVTLKCPSCATTFSAEGVRPFPAVCTSCGFSAMV